MEENKDKNINFLSDSSKNKKTKNLKRIEKDEYEPDMVRPDSEKLKKAKKINISGSDISFFQKTSNWLGSKFSFTKTKKIEKPRIQELQELIGKGQHVGEVMINDDEVLPDEEREDVVKKENVQQLSKDKKNTPDELVEEKDKVIFVTKEDNVAELLSKKEESDKIKDKNIVKPQNISLSPNKDVEIPKAEDGIYSMPKSLEDVSLAEPVVNEMEIENLSEAELSSTTKVLKLGLWDKIKTFFSGIFSPEAKELESNKKETGESVLSYELKKFSQTKEEKEGEYIVSTPTEEFAEGLTIMKQDSDKALKEEKEERATLEEKAPSFTQSKVIKGQGKEELLKAQEELFSNLPEQSPELEDIFAKVGNESEDFKPEEKEVLLVEKKLGLWDKIKTFFSGIFSPKAKELELDKGEELIEKPIEIDNTEILKSEETTEESPAEPEPILENIPEPEKPAGVDDAETLKPAEVIEESPAEPEPILENIPEPEKPAVEEEVKLIAEEDMGVQESLPKSLTEPSLDLPEISENTEENKNIPELEIKISFFDKLKDFFRKLFGQKEVKLDKNIDKEIKIAQYNDQEDVSYKKGVIIHEVVNESPAAVAGVQSNDVVLSINGQSLDSAGDFYKLIQENNKQEIKLAVQRGEENIEFDILPGVVKGNDNSILGFSMTSADFKSFNAGQGGDISDEIIEEDELSTKFHQPSVSTVVRIIDEEGGVDLIPIAIRTKSWAQIAQLLIAATIGSVVIVLSFFATLYFQEINLQKDRELQESQISDLEQKILDYKYINQEIDDLGLEIETVYGLFSKHIYWTNLFAMIEKYTLEDVYLSGFSSAAGGSLSFSATGKGYDTAARQLKLLQSEEAKEFVTSASINAVNNNVDFVTFSINLVLNQELFYYSE